MDQATAKRRYQQHKNGATDRGIGFELTFEQWLAEWGDKLNQRGVGREQYGMCRVMDKGPYAVGNVYIGTPKRNAHTRRVVAADECIKTLRQEQCPEPPPDEIDENPWLPDELRGHKSWSWERIHY